MGKNWSCARRVFAQRAPIVGWQSGTFGCIKVAADKTVDAVEAELENSQPSCRLPYRKNLFKNKVPTMKLDKIYTRTGDEGKTSLGDGSRLPKYHLRVTAYGSIDEANSVIGVALLHVPDRDVIQVLRHIQNDLFDVGADLCQPEQPEKEMSALRIIEEQVTWLEKQIDHFNAELEPLNSFVLPGGSPASTYMHLARTITRRAERDVVRLSAEEPVNPAVLRYVNRLSDLFFVLGRFLNDKGREDVRWQPGLHR
jgi:cob(I)alamin adenosyltransferase